MENFSHIAAIELARHASAGLNLCQQRPQATTFCRMDGLDESNSASEMRTVVDMALPVLAVGP
jgi:hypothetical protein